VVLNRRGDDVIAGLDRTKDCQIVAFGTAAGEDDLGRTAAQKDGDVTTRLLDGGPGFLPFLVNRGGVAEGFEQPGTHYGSHLGKERRGGIRVHVDAGHVSILSFLSKRACA
jgi:hypothetical protein